MSGSDNGPLNYVPKNDVRDLNGFSYSAGILSFTSTATSPTLTLVSSLPPDPSTGKNGAVPIGSRYGERHPIDSSTYHLLVLRINSSRDTTARILWGGTGVGRAVAPFDITQGWHTYVVDMNSVSVGVLLGSVASWSASPWEELVLIPTNSSGVSMNVDFIELLSDTGCGTGGISFNATAL